MKQFLLILQLALSGTSFSQETQIGFGLSSGANINGHDFVVDNSDNVYLAYLYADSLFVNKYDGFVWSSTTIAGGVLDSNVFDMTMIHDPLSDSVFIAYTKADGFYVRTFDGTWSTPSFFSSLPANPTYPEMRFALNEFDKEIHFLFETDDGPIDVEYLIFDIPTGVFTLEAQPDFDGLNNYEQSIIYNPVDGFVYVTHRVGLEDKIQLYTGSNWVNLDSDIIDAPGASSVKTALFRADGQNDIIVVYSYQINSSYYRGAIQYSCTSYSKTQILEEMYSSTTPAYLYEYASNTSFFYAHYTTYQSSLDYAIVGQNETYHTFGIPTQYNPQNFYLSESDNLYWTTYASGDLNLFMNGSFALGTEDNLQEEQTKIYPNPATNQIQISSEELNSISFYSINGALIKDGLAVSKSQPLNIDFLSKGLYLVMLENEEGVVSQQRIVVE